MNRNNDSLNFDHKSYYNDDRDSYIDKDGNYVYTRWVKVGKKYERQIVDIIPLTAENRDIIILLDDSDHDMDLQDRYAAENADYGLENQKQKQTDGNQTDGDSDQSFNADPMENIADSRADVFSTIFPDETPESPLVIAAVAVLVAAFVHLWQTNEEFREKVTAIWNRVKEVFSGFVDGIKQRLDALGIDFGKITESIKKIWDGFCNLLAPVFIAAFEIIEHVLETVLGVLTGLFDVFAGIFTGDWDMVWTGVKEVFSSIWNGIKSTATTMWNGIKSFFSTTLPSIKSTFSTIWEGIHLFTILGSILIEGAGLLLLLFQDPNKDCIDIKWI